MLVDYVNFYARTNRTKYTFEKFQKYFGRKILDVGCDKAFLKTMIKNIEYVGVDISGNPDVYVDLEKTQRLPFEDSSFDCVICSDVLEHLDNLHLIFSELLRVSGRYVIIAWPNNWVNARIPIERGHGHFKHYGLPPEKPLDRHKWFFSLSEAENFVKEQIQKNRNIQLVEERVSEKPKIFPLHLLRHIRYPKQEYYLNRYAHTLWTVLQKKSEKKTNA
jgi:SAM-dependent methyltransferase